MNFKNTHSVKWRLIRAIAIVMSIIMLGSLIRTVNKYYNRDLITLKNKMNSIHQVQEDTFVLHLEAKRMFHMQMHLNSLKKDKNFTYAKITDKNKKIISELGKNPKNKEYIVELKKTIMMNKENKKEIVGNFHLIFSKKEMLLGIKEDMIDIIKVHITLLIITLLMIYIAVSYYISKPMKIITNVIKKTSDFKQTIKIPISSNDEFGVMSTAFNYMSKELRGHFNSVKKKQNELEIFNEKLIEAKKKADVANRTKSQFLATMSHELRTPLNAIIGYTEIIKEDAQEGGDDQLTSDLNRITSSASHLLNLINDVLDISKIESGKMEVNENEFSLKEFLNEIENISSPLINKGGNVLNIVNSIDLDSLYMDSYKLKQTLINIIGNAAKFTSSGVIKLRITKEASNEFDWIKFSVEDSGIGMTGKQLSRIFNPFMQADSSTTRKYGGTGLGLAITKKICELMCGTLSAESELGKGSTFSMKFPLKTKESSYKNKSLSL